MERKWSHRTEEQKVLSAKKVGNIWVNINKCQVYEIVIVIHSDVKKEF